MSRLPISMNRPNSARQESPIGMASAARALSTTSTPRPSVSSMTVSVKSPRRESITCLTPRVLQQGAFGWTTGGGDDFGPEMVGRFGSRPFRPRRAGVDENRFAGA